MHAAIDDQLVDYFQNLFKAIFSKPFGQEIKERLKRNLVSRQVEEAADAASQSLTRFFRNEQLDEAQVACVLASLSPLAELLSLDRIASGGVTPEAIVAEVLPKLPCAGADAQPKVGAIYREAVHSVVQVVLLVGPVMKEWQNLSFATTFELPRRLVGRLNQISEQLGALGRSGREARDERYELNYRDFLLQRFHRIEAGTVRMTTNLSVDLSELFVMPRVLPRTPSGDGSLGTGMDSRAFMDLSAARTFYAMQFGSVLERKDETPGLPALDQLRAYPRNILIGPPGSGKSTFTEWLQLKVAGALEEFVLAGAQAIPLLLRVRQLDSANLPRGAALIERATGSGERASLMPDGWIDRMMEAGRVLFLLDGLDETEPELRDKLFVPWLSKLIRDFPKCQYVVSSRPVGYPSGLLRSLEFEECDLLDFDSSEMAEYARHWCIAVRLARNEPEQEARTEGIKDGDDIIAGFRDHPYIRDLARNPLMLSAICLVRYFEGGKLPEDRAILYKLCVEGLLHHWDQRRGIHSQYSMEEKVRACREVALAMQLNNRAEYEAEKVRTCFSAVLRDQDRGLALFEHIRYRAGLLLERRAEVFAFAHLTFQEYLAARAVHEGNQLGIDAETLAQEHCDGRWKEVVALYCGLAPAPAVRTMLERLIAQNDSPEIAEVLVEAYLPSAPEIKQDRDLRTRVLERVARSPGSPSLAISALERFTTEEVAPIANAAIGTIRGANTQLSEAFKWLQNFPEQVDRARLRKKILHRTTETPHQLSELIYLAFRSLDLEDLVSLTEDVALISSDGPSFAVDQVYSSHAAIAAIGLAQRPTTQPLPALLLILTRLLDSVLSGHPTTHELFFLGQALVDRFKRLGDAEPGQRREFGAAVASLFDRTEELFKADAQPDPWRRSRAEQIEHWKACAREVGLAGTVSQTEDADRPGPRRRRRSPRR
jgi:hypothetical protein